jgi:hypothetical protein
VNAELTTDFMLSWMNSAPLCAYSAQVQRQFNGKRIEFSMYNQPSMYKRTDFYLYHPPQHTKINSEWITNQHIKLETTKPFTENIGTIGDFIIGREFLATTPNVGATEEKLIKWNLLKLNIFFYEDIAKRMKRQVRSLEKIFEKSHYLSKT